MTPKAGASLNDRGRAADEIGLACRPWRPDFIKLRRLDWLAVHAGQRHPRRAGTTRLSKLPTPRASTQTFAWERRLPELSASRWQRHFIVAEAVVHGPGTGESLDAGRENGGLE